MRLLVLMVTAVLAAFGADDAWVKVQKADTGTELRIFKRGESKPIIATLDNLTDESLVVVVKNEEIAIPREQIDRIDARPGKSASKVTKETHESTTEPEHSAKPQENRPGPSTSYGTSYSMGGRPDFVTIYRRTASSPK